LARLVGFNADSDLGATNLAVFAMIVTNTSAAVGMLAWMLMDKLKTGKPTLLGALSGAITGLAAITPASGYVNITAAIIIGFFASVCGYYRVSYIKPRFGYDDALDVFGIHGMSGIVGTIAAGFFATHLINSAIKGGLLYGIQTDEYTAFSYNGYWSLHIRHDSHNWKGY